MSKKSNFLKLFTAAVPDPARVEKVAAMPDPVVRYLIAMTPRSGSSHLCDVLKNTKNLGRPGEMLSQQFIPNILKSAPGGNPDAYLKNIYRVVRTPNGVSGIKASWFQFQDFREVMADPAELLKCRFVHLTRRNLAAQAVSLYRATETNVFHTNVEHSADALGKLSELGYDFEKIHSWYKHIAVQELGWKTFFAENNIIPMSITYEDIEEDVIEVVQRIARFIGRPRAAASASTESIFRKIGERVNVEWACQFALDHDAQQRRLADKAAPGLTASA